MSVGALKLQVLYFAHAQELAGIAEEPVEVPPGSTVRDVVQTLEERHPSLAELLGRSRFAVDQEFATLDDAIVREGEFAVIPPVSGG
ncbi:MAG: molybdopterin converting factor subunit 1 [Planctomycetota bacterium]